MFPPMNAVRLLVLARFILDAWRIPRIHHRSQTETLESILAAFPAKVPHSGLSRTIPNTTVFSHCEGPTPVGPEAWPSVMLTASTELMMSENPSCSPRVHGDPCAAEIQLRPHSARSFVPTQPPYTNAAVLSLDPERL